MTVHVVTGERLHGTIAREYTEEDLPADEAHRRKATRYIEIDSGAQFWFRIDIGREFKWKDADAVDVYAYVDGKRSGGIVMRKPLLQTQGGFPVFCDLDGFYTGTGATSRRHQWSFADLETSEWKANPTDRPSSNNA